MEKILHKAGFEDLFPILIFLAVIVAQLIKAGKKLTGGKRPAPPADAKQPRDEIRDFLEQLTGERPERREKSASPATDSAPPPPPPPLPRAPAPAPARSRPAPDAARRPKVRDAAAPRPKPVERAKPAEPPGAVWREKLRPEFSWDATQEAEASIVPDRERILEELGDRASLARAVVLREILDAPVSLRARS